MRRDAETRRGRRSEGSVNRRRPQTGRRRRASPYRLFTLAALLAGSAVAVALRLQFGMGWLPAYLTGVNVATVLLYAYDKGAAIRQTWLRVPERVLHGAALLGGTPGALVAQSVLRHKTIKQSFRAWFVATLVLQVLVVAAWAYWQYRGGITSRTMPIRTKQWDDPREPEDGYRLLVSRYRPRGLAKADETWDAWEPDLGPSRALHAAFYGKGGVPVNWPLYRNRYRLEMRQQRDRIAALGARSRAGETITLLCSSACRRESRCHRSLLRELIDAAESAPPGTADDSPAAEA